ncbi:MAG: [FeFe] hydrogenase H-cluster maturation GTPase HydF, partial [Ectothiorhodospiraceae bacterium]|nr:[FeFe] hydrogenase H-cluster maturation GTPase HydF [Ectothiorhodospiraceae bacterium]
VPGTTTDPVEKAMEFSPLGPVVFIDTAGIDEVDDLGERRAERTMKALDRCDVAVLVTDDWQEYEDRLVELFHRKKIAYVVAANKSDLRRDDTLAEELKQRGVRHKATTSAENRSGLPELKRAIIRAVPDDFVATPSILGDLVQPGDLVMLVVPIDIEAPKGRLILPQVQTLRDILDNDAYAMVVKERELTEALRRLNAPPALVVTDSQEFLKVAGDTPPGVPLTSFSILFARLKGDLHELVKGVMTLEQLGPGDKVLVAESCTHHPSGDDIGRVKIPRWIEQYVGGKLDIDVFAGHDFPGNIEDYKLVIHCGACVNNRKEMLSRIEHAKLHGVPITNYGLTIAYSLGIFERALRPFPYAFELYNSLKN